MVYLALQLVLEGNYDLRGRLRGRRGRDRMVVRFTTTYVISAYHR
jgi:hypothetical protein